MNFLKTLFSGGDTVKAVGDIADKLFTSDEERLAQQAELEKAAMTYDLEVKKLDAQALHDQTEINKVEAAHESVFVSGWRPAVGWICALALGYAAIVEPIIRMVATLNGYTGEYPQINTDLTEQLLYGILGLGIYRTAEKFKGVSKGSKRK